MRAANKVEMQYRAQNIANRKLTAHGVSPSLAMAEPDAKIKVFKDRVTIDIRMSISMEEIQAYLENGL